MQLSAKNILKMLPLDGALKHDVLQRFDTLNMDQRHALVQILWQTYDAMFETKLSENFQLALDKVKNGQEKLDDSLYKRVVEQTEKEIQSETLEHVEKTDLEAARKAMEKIVQEINAAKKQSPKTP